MFAVSNKNGSYSAVQIHKIILFNEVSTTGNFGDKRILWLFRRIFQLNIYGIS